MSGGVSYVPPLDVYALNNLEDADPLYVGKATASGKWLVQKFTSAGVMTYANVTNNPTVTNYTDAWTGRVSLTYDRYEEIDGV